MNVPAPLVPVVPAYGDTVAVAESSSGVVSSDCGIGGSALSSDAPNDIVGLKVLMTAVNPVVCGRSGAPVGWLDSAVLPVGHMLSKLKTDPEKVDPVVVDAVLRPIRFDMVILGEPKEDRQCDNDSKIPARWMIDERVGAGRHVANW